MGMESNKRGRGIGMESKKEYRTPELAVHGDIDELTRNGPRVHHIDVPLGTLVVGRGLSINDVTS